MEQYIPKSAVLAKIEKIRRIEITDNDVVYNGALDEIRHHIDTLEVKEVDLGKEIEKCLKQHNMLAVGRKDFTDIAKRFFELGLKASSPIIAADRGTAEEIIINLKRVEKDYRIDLTREIEWLRNKVKKGE